MPLYQYRCRECDHGFEALVGGRPDEDVRCPECRAARPDRVIGLPAVGRVAPPAATNCRGDGPPCGAPWCGRGG
jgi:putative FmdB family regulatory protein